ncbi:hypothetical protein SAMN04487939_1261, partial [Lysobacter sp. yr284]
AATAPSRRLRKLRRSCVVAVAARAAPTVGYATPLPSLTSDGKRQSRAFVRKRPSYFLLAARQKKVTKEKRFSKITSHQVQHRAPGCAVRGILPLRRTRASMRAPSGSAEHGPRAELRQSKRQRQRQRQNRFWLPPTRWTDRFDVAAAARQRLARRHAPRPHKTKRARRCGDGPVRLFVCRRARRRRAQPAITTPLRPSSSSGPSRCPAARPGCPSSGGPSRAACSARSAPRPGRCCRARRRSS